MQTKGNEASTRIKNSNQNYQPRIAQKHSQQKGRPPRFRYQILFHGYCYCCSNFGHNVANCEFNFKSMQLRISKNIQLLQHRTRQSMSKQEHHTTQFTTKTRTQDRNINSFDLLSNELECYVCHNFGHKASDYHLKNYKIDASVNYSTGSAKFWKKKEDNTHVSYCFLFKGKKAPGILIVDVPNT